MEESTNNGGQPKPKITEQERLELAAKLDQELDDFINSLEKKRYSEGWNEETWQEEMDKHPFFMKKPPEEGDEVHPMIEGLQQLKYDESENSQEDLASKYKEDGNYYIKHKKYRMAILSYSEGLEFKHENNELIANLYNNRSAANFFVANYRSAINDAKKALELKSDYSKAKIRIVKSLIELKKYDEALTHITDYLVEDPSNKDLIDLQKKAITEKTLKARDERKQSANEKKKQQEFEKTVDALIERGVKIEEIKDGNLKEKLTPEILKPKLDPLELFPVKLDEGGDLYWPAVFCYPEYEVTDLQQQLSENISLRDCLKTMLKSPMEQDTERKYMNVDELHVYYENRILAKIFKVDCRKLLKDIISAETFYVYGGYLTFFIVPRNTTVEKKFIHQKRDKIY